MGKKIDFDKIIKAAGLDKPEAIRRYTLNMKKLLLGRKSWRQ